MSVLKISQRKETFYAIMEWLPELLLLLVDIAILVKSGNMSKVAGASVTGLIVSLGVRKPVQMFFVVAKEQASKYSQDSDEFKSYLSVLPLCTIIAMVSGVLLWAFRWQVQSLIGLDGIGDYLTYGCFSAILFRCLVVGYIVLGMAQVRMKEKMVLSWLAATLNYFLSDSLVNTMGVSGVALGTLLSVFPHCIVLYWAAQEKVIGKVEKEYVVDVWNKVKINMKGEIPSWINTSTAICLNGWLGPVHGFAWTILHSVDDVANGLAMVTLGVGQRHATRYHKLGDIEGVTIVWLWATKIALCFSIGLALIASIWLGKWYVLLVVPMSLICKWSFMKTKIPATEEAYETAAYVGGRSHISQAVGYGVIILVAPAGIWWPLGWYCVVKVVSSVYLKIRNYK